MKKDKKVKNENEPRKLKGNWFYYAVKRIVDIFKTNKINVSP